MIDDWCWWLWLGQKRSRHEQNLRIYNRQKREWGNFSTGRIVLMRGGYSTFSHSSESRNKNVLDFSIKSM